MGCTQSSYTVDDFTSPVTLHVPKLYKTSTDQVNQIKMRINAFSHDPFRIDTVDGEPFAGGIQVKGKWFRTTLLDPSGNPIAVCMRKSTFFNKSCKIYTLLPLFNGQTKSEDDFDGHPLYTFAEVVRGGSYVLKFAGEENPSIMVETHSILPMTLVVRYRKQLIALIERGTLNSNWDTYRLITSPGVDTCLIICICAICDEMEKN